MKRKIYVIILIIAIAAAGGVFFICSETSVEALEVGRGSLKVVIEETGYVEADDNYLIQAPSNGRIIGINVHRGQQVEAGQVLMTLESLDMDEQLVLVNGELDKARAEYEQAKNNLEIAGRDLEELRRKLDRDTELFKAGAISQANYDTIMNQVNNQENLVAAQQASLKGMERQLAALTGQRDVLQKKEQELVITSRTVGRILDIPVKNDQIVATGTNLLELANPDMRVVKIDLLSDDMGNIKVGQKAEITSPVLNGRVLTGTVKEIYPKAFEKVSALGVSQRRVPVEIAINADENLKDGYEVNAAIESSSQDNVLVIPWEAVRTSASGDNEVMLISNHKIVYQPIKIGLENTRYVEVVEGLQAGDQIVLDGSLSLKPGTRVRIKRN
jgi:HlyD family secretion protein